MSKENTLKLLLIGSGKVGKSTILLRYCKGKFFETIGATVGVDFRFSNIKVNNENVKLQIWDTAGQERFRTITGSYYRNAHGILVVYDVTDEETFDQVEDWVKEIYQNAPEDCVILLFGNKTDLVDLREVSKEAGTNLAERMNITYLEGSAKSGENISNAFQILAERSFKKIKKKPKPTKETKKKTLKNITFEEEKKQKKCC
ncbi:ras family protein [Anaeramoeba flamelloides]|uniref:Ras family protein n=1 Tax=Anaeramoeba flamelloides TaxID=1746091 RepID=A0AAV8AEJ5_9EUKA|nr:ras-related protein ric1 [Anaeramoeba flamelloides]KAJ6255406.1 ras family protein [Anaeramoeba flamelloides]